MKELDEYFKLQQTIYGIFEYKEAWRVYPLDDMRDAWWNIEGDTVYWSDKKESFGDDDSDDMYSGEIKRSRHLETSIYEDKDKKFTMIIVDTNTDFNVFLMIFDNDKRLQ